jgi:type II secretory pathway component GspD/PulD (secretin)
LDTNILSAPRITTVNNRKAEIKIIESYPWAEPEASTDQNGNVTVTWKINYEEIGIVLKVEPTINNDGMISMVLEPEVSEKTGDLELTTSGVTYKVPIIDKRSASTKVVIGDGQTLIIGGLIKDKTTKGSTKVPLLGDIPGLGYLFKSKKDTTDKTELLIFVSPTIITPNEFVRMARREKYGIGKSYLEDREKEEGMLSALEKKEKDKQSRLASDLEALIKRQKSLAEESKGLEEAVLKEEKDLKALEADRDSIIKKRKGLIK